METTPRLFWRRLIAFQIDVIAAYLFTAVILLPLVVGNTDNFRLSESGIKSTKCWQSKTAPPEIFELAEGFELTSLQVCDRWVFGVYNGRSVSLQNVTSDRESRTRTTKSMTIPTNEAGVPVQPWIIQDVLVAAVMLFVLPVSALVWGGATPGKRLLGVFINGKEMSFIRLCLREVLKWGPVFAVFVITLLMAPQTFKAIVSTSPGVMLAVYSLPIVAGLIWWAVPLVRWKGRMPYDRIAKFEVSRRSK